MTTWIGVTTPDPRERAPDQGLGGLHALGDAVTERASARVRAPKRSAREHHQRGYENEERTSGHPATDSAPSALSTRRAMIPPALRD